MAKASKSPTSTSPNSATDPSKTQRKKFIRALLRILSPFLDRTRNFSIRVNRFPSSLQKSAFTRTRSPTSSASASDLAASDKRLIQTLLWALKPLVNLRGSIPLPFVTTFLMVALDEGKGVNEYARALGVHRATMSRHLRGIGDRARHGGPGLGLVTVTQHPTDALRRQVFLTTKGRSVAKKVVEQIRRGSNLER
jgi:DNA-binding MarR family transcriptional regulator